MARVGSHDVGGELYDGQLALAEKAYAFWERQVHALLSVLVSKSLFSASELRRGIEGLPEEAYKRMSYYQKWASSIAAVSIERGTITEEDLQRELGSPLQESEIKYSQGDYVRVKQEDSAVRWRRPHLRTPGYIFGVVGVIERPCVGYFEDPELGAYRAPGPRQPLYRVRFQQSDLWEGYAGDSNDAVDVEIFQPWLEPAFKREFAEQQAKRARLPRPRDPTHQSRHAHHRSHDGYESGHDHHHDRPDAHEHSPNNAYAHADSHEHGLEHQQQHQHHEGEGVIDHGDHVHEGRQAVEQNAVDMEGDDVNHSAFPLALIRAFIHKGVVTAAALREAIEAMDSKGVRQDGARLVAKAWADDAFKQRLLADTESAAKELSIATSNYTAQPVQGASATPPVPGTLLLVVENTPALHNLVVCTLCSCYPISVLGMSPPWYKSRGYRARAVRDPRGVLREFGTELPPGTAVRVHDSTAECRYLVLPMQPAGTEGWTEEQLMGLVTRDCMIGVALPRSPAELPSSTAVVAAPV